MNALRRMIPILVAAGLFLAACGGGGGGGTTVSISYEAPQGSGYADGLVNGVPMAPSVRRDFTFADGIDVTGQVTDWTGAPIAGARVSYHLTATTPGIDSDSTDAAGNYGVTLSAGTWIALVEADQALGTLTVPGIVLAAPGPVVRDFAFPAPHQVSGHVLDSLGAGIDGARVQFRGDRTGARVTVFCDAGGAYAAMLEPDTYEAVVTPAGPAQDTHLRQRFPGIVVANALVRDFTLRRGVTVSGTVFDDLGLPLLEETDIDAELGENSVYFAPDGVTTDAGTGMYEIGPLPLEAVTFVVRPPEDLGFPAQRFVRSVVGPLVQTENFMLLRGVVLSGTIVRDDGTTPEADARVELIPANRAIAPDDDRTDGSGSYRIALFPGTYEMRITPRPDNLQLPESRGVRITGATTIDVTLTRGAILQGTVRDPSGTPIENIRIEIPGVLGASDTTDGSGLYSFLAPSGTHTLALTAEGGPFEDVALAPVEGVLVTLPGPVTADVTFALATTGSRVVRGTVYAPGGVATVAGVAVEAVDATGAVVGRTVTDGAGGYVLVMQ
jgi:Carboxypeptidase regulatory-like domain